ncbi:MAG: transglycosylase SLT domain-containing protein [Eubacteriales bacterium]|nr:transglycosylase SLT domain-containing protein [Eubacteriales bacterium]
MIHTPYPRRDQDDDYAPVDYSYVPSVSEGQRIERLKNIHPEAKSKPLVKHRVDPFEQSQEVSPVRAQESVRSRRSGVASRLPTAADGPAPAARIAYPTASPIPDNPFDPQEGSSSDAKGPDDVLKAPIVMEDGSQFDPPAMAQMPEWYRVAQQNSAPRDERRRAPKVEAAPHPEETAEPTDILGRPLRRSAPRPEAVGDKQADVYARAGYPPELLEAQQRLDAEREVIVRRRRHGAQYAVNQYAQSDYERSVGSAPLPTDGASYPPSREEYARRRALTREEQERRAQAGEQALQNQRFQGGSTAYSPAGDSYAPNPYAAPAPQQTYGQAQRYEEQRYDEEPAEETERPRLNIPWLGIAIFAAAALAVGLWVMQLTFTTQKNEIIEQRAQAIVTLRNEHPYEYRDLIEREAAKNNLNPAFVAAIVFNESSFRTGAESNVGARGLMQVMEETAADIGNELQISNYSFDMLYDAETNLLFGCYYLGQLSQRFRGDPVLVSAAYHAGANQVQNWLNTSAYSSDGLTLNLESMTEGPTTRYASRVKRDFAIYKRLYYQNREDDA